MLIRYHVTGHTPVPLLPISHPHILSYFNITIPPSYWHYSIHLLTNILNVP